MTEQNITLQEQIKDSNAISMLLITKKRPLAKYMRTVW